MEQRTAYQSIDVNRDYYRYNDLDLSRVKAFMRFKRVTDIILSLIGLVFAIPIMLTFGLAIKLESRGCIFYKQKRLGRFSKTFTIFKMRSMVKDAEKDGPKLADKNDCRVTKVGRFMRKKRIDELPQLFNILIGDMSIVGPRPERPSFTYELEKEIPGFVNRLKIKPGLTGLAQINGGYDITPEEKLKFDLIYIANMNILMDLRIMLKTIIIVLNGSGAR
jgi:lipopolysaccharide/colanic/teichoic acid biosynthesis glycosyltransferase